MTPRAASERQILNAIVVSYCVEPMTRPAISWALLVLQMGTVSSSFCVPNFKHNVLLKMSDVGGLESLGVV